MKPQCETTADCYIELGRVMNEFGIYSHSEVLRKGYALFNGKLFEGTARDNQFGVPELWSFAIAKLEDKPVFLGDTVFSTVSGSKFTAGITSDNRYWWFNYLGEPQHPITSDISNLSWTPPKQTVSLKVGDNEPVEVPIGITVIPAFGDARGVFVQCKTPEAAVQFRNAMKPLVKE